MQPKTFSPCMKIKWEFASFTDFKNAVESVRLITNRILAIINNTMLLVKEAHCKRNFRTVSCSHLPKHIVTNIVQDIRHYKSTIIKELLYYIMSQ